MVLQKNDIPKSENEFPVSQLSEVKDVSQDLKSKMDFIFTSQYRRCVKSRWHKLWQTRRERMMLAIILFTLLMFVAMILPSSYLVQKAGPAIDVNSQVKGKSIVEVKGVQTYQSSTKLFMTTVSAWGSPDSGVPGAQAFAALFQQDAQLIPVRAYYPKEISADDVEKHNKQLMNNSQDAAALLAFEMAGHKVKMDVKIVAVDKTKPSGKLLKSGDIIRGISVGEKTSEIHRTHSHYELSKVLDAVQPGTVVNLEIERAGKNLKVSFPTLPYRADSTGWVHPGSLLGVAITVENIKLPAKVKYIIDGIGGPSAGNMFALGIYDAITPGSLGGDAKIAGTGTVAWDGDVGPIGGIRHKMRGAAAVGATDFLAPAENCAETIGAEPPGMNVWAVRSTEESVKAVKAISAKSVSGLKSCKDVVRETKK